MENLVPICIMRLGGAIYRQSVERLAKLHAHSVPKKERGSHSVWLPRNALSWLHSRWGLYCACMKVQILKWIV